MRQCIRTPDQILRYSAEPVAVDFPLLRACGLSVLSETYRLGAGAWFDLLVAC
ncbi:MAG: hypothetical protein ACLSFT_12290 [Ruminococcus callidus]